jgi:hypothetical protein
VEICGSVTEQNEGAGRQLRELIGEIREIGDDFPTIPAPKLPCYDDCAIDYSKIITIDPVKRGGKANGSFADHLQLAFDSRYRLWIFPECIEVHVLCEFLDGGNIHSIERLKGTSADGWLGAPSLILV